MRGSIHHIDLTVGDLSASTAFYDIVMPLIGLRRSIDVPEGPIWAGRSVELGLVQARSGAQSHDRFSPGLHHLAFHSPDRASVDRVHQQLLQHRVIVLDAPTEYPRYAKGYYALFFADPDGLKLEYVFTPHWPSAT